MSTNRRDLLKLGALAAAGALAWPWLSSRALAAVPKAPRPLRILILGGTGFTGPFQVAYALARGHTVTLFNRGRRPTPEWPGSVEQLHGDRNTGDLKALEGREWDVCIDNPTTLPFWVRDAGRVLSGRVGHYLFISSISAYADGSRPGLDEDAALARYDGSDPMAETLDSLMANVEGLFGPLKAASEREAVRQFGERTTIVRPGYIVGPRDETDRFTYWPRRIAQGGDVLVPGDGLDPVQIIDGRDLGEWMIRLAEAGTTGTFNACGPDYTLTMDALAHGCHAVSGGPARFVHVPSGFLEAHDLALPIWVPRTGSPYSGYGAVSNARARAAGLTFRPLATTVSDLLTWYRGLPADRQAEVRAGPTREQEAAVLAAWRAKQG